MRAIMLLSLLVYSLSGCVSINISLVEKGKPLQETVIEGEGKEKILLLDISGTISSKARPGRDVLGGSEPSMVETIQESLRKAEKDDQVKGIVLRINSPGGSVTASDIIYHEIKRFREKKKIPVYASIMDIGASGAYYIATATDGIYAHPTAITGSIGVITFKVTVTGLMDKIGVGETTFKSGDLKDIMMPFRPTTPEEKEIMQNIINTLFDRFLGVVYDQRRKMLTMEEIHTLADGRPYTAAQALDAKLIDGIAYLDETLKKMKDKIGAPDARIVAYNRPGEYKATIYSLLPAPETRITDLIEDHALSPLPGVEFMYLWSP